MKESSGLYCTNLECLSETDKFYKVVAGDTVIDFGLCFKCATDVKESVLIQVDSEVNK